MIKFLDLKSTNQQYRSELISACTRVIDSGWYVCGKELEAFERSFSEYCNADYCVGVANGLDALSLTLRSWIEIGKLQKGDEVLVPANTFIASVFAITENDLIPVLIEPDPLTFNMSTESLVAAITDKSRVIMPVHLYGQMADMPKIMTIAKKYQLLVLEDAAQAQGASIAEVKAGAWGDAAAFSFYPGKVLGALGDAGAVTSNDELLVQTLRALRSYGSDTKYEHRYVGANSRLDEIQAAMLSIKLAYLDNDIERRQTIAARYLDGIKHSSIQLPKCKQHQQHSWHLFVLRCNQRDKLQQQLTLAGIETLVHYPIPIHQQSAYASFNHKSFPITEKIQSEVLSVPIGPCLQDQDVDNIIQTLNGVDL
ncbi:UDP-4-amino-4-deoxy-L-arabinose--oxoglutarate aminotransferase [hydrothermal vent metagenome]|uniref:UDP-4-amino-4-deoxy-L-arabinose--oxoglutarate aminotransferase n=1 Tax=hydrothermal vent metagenome TaxID=652676 RepID=A0A3B0Y3Y6_9ZZZZ